MGPGLHGGGDIGEEFDGTELARGRRGHAYATRFTPEQGEITVGENLATATTTINVPVAGATGIYAGAPDFRNPAQRTWDRFSDHMSRNKIRYVAGAISGVLIATASYLSWYFTCGPGKISKFNPVDKPLSNQPRSLNMIAIDVITGSVNACGTTPVLVGADMQGVLTQPGIGTWKVNSSNDNVEFTPDPAYNFNTPATAKFRLSLAGVESDDSATITITYVAATMTDPTVSEQTLTANYKDTVTFDMKNATGTLVLVKPDTTSPSTQTEKNIGVWTITDASHVTFKADAAFKGIRVETSVKLDLGNSKFSSAVTLTVMYKQPKAADRFIQGYTPGQAADKINVADSAVAQAPNTIVATSVKLVGLQDLEMGSVPSKAVTMDGKQLVADGEGTWMVGDAGTISFVPATQKAATGYQPGRDRDDFTGTLGFRFQSAASQTVMSLGIRKGTGNTGVWTVSLADAKGNVLVSAKIDLTDSNKQVGQFYYEPVASLKLSGGTSYYLLVDVVNTLNVVPRQYWSHTAPVTLDSKIASGATAVYRHPGGVFIDDGVGNAFIGLDFTVLDFELSPTPVVYTISDDQGNTSNEALIVLNYGAKVSNSDLNSETDDTKFFANVKKEAIDYQPALDLVVLLATLEYITDITAIMLKPVELGMSPISDTDFAARYTKFESAATSTELWDTCQDIDKAKVDPTGVKSDFYARYWRMRTMTRLLKQLVVELDLT